MDEEAGMFTQVTRLFRKKKLSCDEASQLTELIGEMASRNIIAKLESKMETQNTKFTLLLWFIGVGTAILAAMLSVLIAAVSGAS